MFCFSNVGREMACWKTKYESGYYYNDDERDIRNANVNSNCEAVFWLCMNIMYERWWKI